MIIEVPYDRARAVEYAKRWALSRNPLFIDFTGIGGDCTNFVSQCLLAGGGLMNYTPTFGWYYIDQNDRAPAWSGVDELYSFLTGASDFTMENGGFGVFGEVAQRRNQVALGDVVQLANLNGEFYHSLIITGFAPNDILVSAHANDALDRPLSSYNFASARIIHILGSKVLFGDEVAYRKLLEGEELV